MKFVLQKAVTGGFIRGIIRIEQTVVHCRAEEKACCYGSEDCKQWKVASVKYFRLTRNESADKRVVRIGAWTYTISRAVHITDQKAALKDTVEIKGAHVDVIDASSTNYHDRMFPLLVKARERRVILEGQETVGTDQRWHHSFIDRNDEPGSIIALSLKVRILPFERVDCLTVDRCGEKHEDREHRYK